MSAHAAGWALLAVAALAAIWYVDVRLRPVGPCPRCKGTRKAPGRRPDAWAYCGRCNRTGEVRRFGAGRG